MRVIHKRWQGWAMAGTLFAFCWNTSASELILKDFSDVSQLSLNGHAKTVKTSKGTVLRLTSATKLQAGSAFSTVKVSTATFSTYFKFKITEPGGVLSGGDGFAFVVQPISSEVGSTGGGMGYAGIEKSIGVEFDTWNNHRERDTRNDSDSNHVGINIQGEFNGPTVGVSPLFENGKIWYAWIDYDGRQVEVRTNTTGKRPSKPLLTRELDISDLLGEVPEAFIGFTSATGGAFANHEILSWEYRDKFRPIGVESQVDVWMADSKRDKGVEPNKVSRRFWLSPDIWVRNKEDGISKYQNVEFGQDNYVYVRARNRGTEAAHNTTIEVYRSIPAIGNRWPKGWQFVGKAEIETIEPNATQEVAIRWAAADIPKPGHYCFYTRVLNADDPMTFKERGDSLVNMQKNNAIVSRNFNVVDLKKDVTAEFEVKVHNPKDEDTDVDLVFEEEDALLDNDGAEVTVDLGDLYQPWQLAGGKGDNIKPVAGTTKVRLLKTPAKFTGIPMKVDQSQTLLMKVAAFKPMPGEGTSREYQFSTQQWVNGELTGGVDYAMTTRAQDTDTDGDGIKDVTDEDDDNDGRPDDCEIKHGLNPLDPDDVMTVPDTVNVMPYTLELAENASDQVEVTLSNPEQGAGNLTLVLDETNNLLNTGKASVVVDLGALLPRWQAAGAQGVNLGDIKDNQVPLQKTPAKLIGLPLLACESPKIQIKVEPIKVEPIKEEPVKPAPVEEKPSCESPPSTKAEESPTPCPCPTTNTIRVEIVPGAGLIVDPAAPNRMLIAPSAHPTQKRPKIDDDRRYIDKRDGTVVDNKTGLVWLKNANCIGTKYPSFDRDCSPGDGKVNWSDAKAFVTGLNSGQFPDCDANHTDWRLPTLQEMQSLVHYGYYNPAMSNAAGTAPWQENDAFSNVKSDNYWTATRDASNPDFAWRLRFDRGLVFTEQKSYPFYVWPVRSEADCQCADGL